MQGQAGGSSKLPRVHGTCPGNHSCETELGTVTDHRVHQSPQAKSNTVSSGIKSRTVSKSQKNGDTPTVPHSSPATVEDSAQDTTLFKINFLSGLQSHYLKGTPVLSSEKSLIPPHLLLKGKESYPFPLCPSTDTVSTETVCIYRQINICCPLLFLHTLYAVPCFLQSPTPASFFSVAAQDPIAWRCSTGEH